MSRKLYATHRWLGAVIGVQLLAWSTGGLVFSTHNIDWVHGDHTRNITAARDLPLAQVVLSPAEALTRSGMAGVSQIALRNLNAAVVYELKHADKTVLVDAATGTMLSPLDRETATAIAKADQRGSPTVRGVEHVVANPPSEYRGQPLPAWRVAFDDGENTHVYVDAASGLVRARRNDAWRRYDFFWMLHTMDYRGRDGFNHPLLIAFAAFGVITVLSGFVLWFVRLRRSLAKRRVRAG